MLIGYLQKDRRSTDAVFHMQYKRYREKVATQNALGGATLCSGIDFFFVLFLSCSDEEAGRDDL